MTDIKIDIEWSQPIIGEDGKYKVVGSACSSLGLWLRLGYHLVDFGAVKAQFEDAKKRGNGADFVRSFNKLNETRRQATQDQIERKIRALESGQGECGMTHQELVSLTYEEYQARCAAWHAADRARRSVEWSEALRAKFRDSEVNERHQVVIEHDVDDQPWVTW